MLKYKKILIALIIGIALISCENPNEYGGEKKKKPIDEPAKVELELIYAKIEENGHLGYFEVKEYQAFMDTSQIDLNTWLKISLTNREQIKYNYFYPLRLRSLHIRIDSVLANGIPNSLNSSDSNIAKFKIVNAPPDRDTTIFANDFNAISDISFGWSRKEKQLWAFFFSKIVCLRHKVKRIDTTIFVPSVIMSKNKENNNTKHNIINYTLIRKDTTIFLVRPYLDSLYISGKFLFKLK